MSNSCRSSDTVQENTNFEIKIDAPVRNLTMLELHQRAGVEEVYAGVVPTRYEGFSFDSLPLIRGGEPCHISSFKSLSRLVEIAKKQNTSVNFAADTPCLPFELEKEWKGHVSSAIDVGVSSVIVGTLNSLRIAAKLTEGTDVKVVAGLVMGISTIQMAKYVAEEGADRIITPHDLLLPEIQKIKDASGLEIEVPVQTGSGVDASRSRFSDIPGVGEASRAGWATEHHRDALEGPGILDGAGDCALCTMPRLIDMDVTAIHLSGRESPNLKQNAKITQIYRRVIKGMRRQKTMAQVIDEIDMVELTWQMGWVPRLCEQQRGRFQDTPRTRGYV